MINQQQPMSEEPRQLPESAPRPIPPPKRPLRRLETRQMLPEVTSSKSSSVPLFYWAGHEDVKPEYEVEEFFEAVVEAIRDNIIQLRTISSSGEEAMAELSINSIPVTEQKYIQLGAPVRISVIVSALGTRKRDYRIRFLRPFQWRTPDETEQATSYLLEQMKAVLR